jgi:hypothetical protein
MGISRARKQGKALGRPGVEVDPRQVVGLRARGLSWNEIADQLGIGRGTAERAYRSLSQKPLERTSFTRTHNIELRRAFYDHLIFGHLFAGLSRENDSPDRVTSQSASHPISCC